MLVGEESGNAVGEWNVVGEWQYSWRGVLVGEWNVVGEENSS